ncbi:MAG TPA: hypothetical protein VJY54_06395 [Lachnospiraceae bacterium]|nr:hypothetical protein [Lachnospiraceae bacterium]
MTAEDKEILNRINKYAEDVLFDIDPQKVQVSFQIEKLRPILQEIADEQGISLEDFLIRYLDLQSEAACLTDAKIRSEFDDDLKANGEHPFLYR